MSKRHKREIKKERKKQMDEALREFIGICLKCGKYDMGRCPKYNKLMDKMVEIDQVPVCDEAELPEE